MMEKSSNINTNQKVNNHEKTSDYIETNNDKKNKNEAIEKIFPNIKYSIEMGIAKSKCLADKETFLFFGASGSGKSTHIAYLQDCPLTFHGEKLIYSNVDGYCIFFERPNKKMDYTDKNKLYLYERSNDYFKIKYLDKNDKQRELTAYKALAADNSDYISDDKLYLNPSLFNVFVKAIQEKYQLVDDKSESELFKLLKKYGINKLKSPFIGQTSVSETFLMNNYKVKYNDNHFFLCDSQGLDDNRENDKAIAATINMELGINSIKKIKGLILVINKKDLELRAEKFRRLAKIIGDLFSYDLTKLTNSVYVIFTNATTVIEENTEKYEDITEEEKEIFDTKEKWEKSIIIQKRKNILKNKKNAEKSIVENLKQIIKDCNRLENNTKSDNMVSLETICVKNLANFLTNLISPDSSINDKSENKKSTQTKWHIANYFTNAKGEIKVDGKFIKNFYESISGLTPIEKTNFNFNTYSQTRSNFINFIKSKLNKVDLLLDKVASINNDIDIQNTRKRNSEVTIERAKKSLEIAQGDEGVERDYEELNRIEDDIKKLSNELYYGYDSENEKVKDSPYGFKIFIYENNNSQELALFAREYGNFNKKKFEKISYNLPAIIVDTYDIDESKFIANGHKHIYFVFENHSNHICVMKFLNSEEYELLSLKKNYLVNKVKEGFSGQNYYHDEHNNFFNTSLLKKSRNINYELENNLYCTINLSKEIYAKLEKIASKKNNSNKNIIISNKKAKNHKMFNFFKLIFESFSISFDRLAKEGGLLKRRKQNQNELDEIMSKKDPVPFETIEKNSLDKSLLGLVEINYLDEFNKPIEKVEVKCEEKFSKIKEVLDKEAGEYSLSIKIEPDDNKFVRGAKNIFGYNKLKKHFGSNDIKVTFFTREYNLQKNKNRIDKLKSEIEDIGKKIETAKICIEDRKRQKKIFENWEFLNNPQALEELKNSIEIETHKLLNIKRIIEKHDAELKDTITKISEIDFKSFTYLIKILDPKHFKTETFRLLSTRINKFTEKFQSFDVYENFEPNELVINPNTTDSTESYNQLNKAFNNLKFQYRMLKSDFNELIRFVKFMKENMSLERIKQFNQQNKFNFYNPKLDIDALDQIDDIANILDCYDKPNTLLISKIFNQKKSGMKLFGEATNSISNGNCAYNSFALFLGQLVFYKEANLNDKVQESILRFFKNSDNKIINIAKRYTNVVNYFKQSDSAEWQRDLSLPLRKLAVKLLKNEQHNYCQQYYNLLENCLNNYCIDNNFADDTFLVHPFIKDKFTELGNDFAQAQKQLKTWWFAKNSGWRQYLEEVAKPAASAFDRARWGGQELEILAQFFNIGLKYKKGDQIIFLHTPFGSVDLKQFAKEDIQQLQIRGIVFKNNLGFYISHNMDSLDKIEQACDDLTNLLNEDSLLLKSIEQAKENNISAEDNQLLIATDDEILNIACFEQLLKRGIISKNDNNQYKFIKDVALDNQILKQRLSAITKPLVIKIKQSYKSANGICASLGYSGNHWWCEGFYDYSQAINQNNDSSLPANDDLSQAVLNSANKPLLLNTTINNQGANNDSNTVQNQGSQNKDQVDNDLPKNKK